LQKVNCKLEHIFIATTIMANPPSDFRFELLRAGQIRLLSISIINEQVELSLHRYYLQTAPEYYAISYAWGTEQRTTSVLCNLQTMTITPHVYEGLRCINSLYGSSIRIWIDSICINQDDNEEKAVQVKNMHEVYAGARAVLAWLGSSGNDSDLAMASIPAMYDSLKDETGPRCKFDEDLARLGLPPWKHPVWCALGRLAVRPWFERLWVVQEVALAQEVYLICGMNYTNFEPLAGLLRAMRITGIDGIFASRLDESEFQTFNLSHARVLGTMAKKDEDASFTGFLGNGRYRACGQPLDRVYGFLGLLSGSYRAQFQVSYSSESREEYWTAYLAAARWSLTHEPTLSILHQKPCTRPLIELPSWCPNYNCEPECRNSLESFRPYPLSGKKEDHQPYRAGFDPKFTSRDNMPKYHFEVSFDARNLYEARISGAQVDEIVSVVTVGKWEWPITAGQLKIQSSLKAADWLSRCWDLASSTVKSELPTLKVFSDTLAGFLQPSHILEDMCTSHYKHILNLLALTGEEEWKLKIKALPKGSPETIWFIISMNNMWQNRVFFATRSGRIGAASRHVRCGDKVCVLFGGWAVYVLRKRPQGPNWQFLHPAYVHGLMSGEVFGMLDRGEVQKEYFTLD
jgi:Heterokaryon incompatibility protein (HET)